MTMGLFDLPAHVFEPHVYRTWNQNLNSYRRCWLHGVGGFHLEQIHSLPAMVKACMRVLEAPMLLGFAFPRVLNPAIWSADRRRATRGLDVVEKIAMGFMRVGDVVDPDYYLAEGADMINRAPTTFLLGFRLGEMFMMQDQER